jgi:site-specific recombinase XerD
LKVNKNSRLSQPRQNKFIKEVFKTLKLQRPVKISRYQGSKVFEESVPLHEAVTTHTARKTFISLALKKGIPLQDVMHMSGHDDYQSMRPYISISREHIRQIGDSYQL